MICIIFFTFGHSDIDLATVSEFEPNTKTWTSSFIWDAAEIALKVKSVAELVQKLKNEAKVI